MIEGILWLACVAYPVGNTHQLPAAVYRWCTGEVASADLERAET
jgi:hypothetical protein